MTSTTDEDLDLLDLDAEAAARRETSKPPRFRFKGEVYTLPSEVPLDLFSPLLEVDANLPLILRQVMEMMDAETDADSRKAATSLAIDLLISRPDLPKDVVAAVMDMGRRLWDWDDEHEGQWQRFKEGRPTREDVRLIVTRVIGRYGVSLPEASRSAEPLPAGGPTSSATSSASTDSTPAAAGKPRARKASSARAG